MRFFDLHCDTVTECAGNGYVLSDNPLHLDLRRGAVLSQWVQSFAIWIPDTLRGDDAWQYFTKQYDFFCREAEANSLRLIRDPSDMDTAGQSCLPSALLCVEGGAVLGGRIDRVYSLHEMGVRLLTLTWNGENELGFGCQTEGGGLKPFGKQVVRELDRMKMLTDVSHLNAEGFWDVLDISDRPVLASHSTSAAVLRQTRKDSTDRTFSLRRALEDDQIRALSERNGLIGLNFCGSFLGDAGDDGLPAALRHAAHIVEIGGEDLLAIGSDFDGCTMHPDLAGIEKIPHMYDVFLHNGFSEALCEKIFFRNAWNFVKSML